MTSQYNSRLLLISCCAIVAVLLVLPVSMSDLYAQSNSDMCYTCHADIGDDASEAYANSIHLKKGVSCAECHGGDRRSEDMDDAMSKSKGFVGKPKKDDISQLCAKCHNDADKMKSLGSSITTGQYSMLAASVHGSVEGGEGSELIMECTTCHSVHDIRKTSDPASSVSPGKVVALCANCHNDPGYMRRYNPSLATDQLAKYRTSTHGMRNARGDVKVATCVSCHTAHDIKKASHPSSSVYAETIPSTCGKCHSDSEYMKSYGIATDQESKYISSVHGNALLEKHDLSAPSCNDCHGNHGAIPPGVESISHVCGSCHPLNAELFRQSVHKPIFAERNLPECETCHGNHGIKPATVEMLSVGEGSICGSCHSSENGPKGYAAALEMNQLLDSLMNTIYYAEELLHDAEQKGMEVDDIRFALRDSRQARLQSRTTVHAFELGKFHEGIDKGIKVAQNAVNDTQEAIDDYFFRRWGLLVVSLIITFIVILLYLYIRRLERRQKAAAAS
jgi:ssDNA-binding Zn-finger/Zn-ribbon topoisomerase 1